MFKLNREGLGTDISRKEDCGGLGIICDDDGDDDDILRMVDGRLTRQVVGLYCGTQFDEVKSKKTEKELD